MFGGVKSLGSLAKSSSDYPLCYNCVMNIPATSVDRIFKRINIDKKTGCWNWVGCKTSGYGQVRVNKKLYRVHRLMYELFVEKPPEGKDTYVLDHLCNNRACCNPTHLQLISDKENILKGNGATARKARQTHCKNGHLLPQSKNGHRRCAICHRAWNRANYAKNPMKFILKTRERRLRSNQLR